MRESRFHPHPAVHPQVSALERLRADRSLRVFAVCLALFLLVGELSAYGWMRGEPPLLGAHGSADAIGAMLNVSRSVVLALAGLVIARAFPITHRPFRNLAVAALLAIAAFAAVHLLFTLGILCTLPATVCPSLRSHLLLVGTYLPIPLAFVSVGWAVELAQRFDSRLEESQRLNADLLEAQVENLTAQMRPHFLFNALNSVSVLLEDDPAAADSLLQRLRTLLTATLERSTYLVPLSAEMELTRAYAEVERVRFSDRLEVAIEVDPGVTGARVPHLLLQPLVENAVRHGISRRPGRGSIRVLGRRAGDRLRIEVSDDGVGLPGDWEMGEAGVGLSNTVGRLDRLYGETYDISFQGRSGGGLTVTLDLPLDLESASESSSARPEPLLR